MTKRMTSLVAIAAALSLTAGCASRRTADQLPPEPPSDSTPADTTEGWATRPARSAAPRCRARAATSCRA